MATAAAAVAVNLLLHHQPAVFALLKTCFAKTTVVVLVVAVFAEESECVVVARRESWETDRDSRQRLDSSKCRDRETIAPQAFVTREDPQLEMLTIHCFVW